MEEGCLDEPFAVDVGAIFVEGSRSTLYRGTIPAGPAGPAGQAGQTGRVGSRHVLVKVLKSNGDGHRLDREYAVGRAIDSPLVVKTFAQTTFDGRPALVLEDFGGHSLEQLLVAPLPPGELLPLAIAITRALGEVHRHGVIHKDIKPANLIIRADTGEAKIADFGLATHADVARQETSATRGIEGTLAYISPEQTGRMNRGVDERSDLYSLGVTFYRMLTGSLPFCGKDTLEWVHSHLAKSPPPPDRLVPGIPALLSQLTLKLLSKAPEDRYQSAAGLLADLERCRSQWAETGRIEPFALGERDLAQDFALPRRLYGRAREVAQLRALFDEVGVANRPRILLVSGYSGVGKTAVVRELHAPVVRERGLFLSGKFDQYRHHVPYSAIVQALSELVQHLLTESAETLATWKREIAAALGSSGRVLTDVVPDLALLIGPQPPVAELGPGESQNRFQLVFRAFVRLLARPGRPVVLLLDDLQWADRASLELLQTIWDSSNGPLLVVLAFRDNEVDAKHPFADAVATMRKAGAAISDVRIAPLAAEHVDALVADALHAPPAAARALSRIVMAKTEGNPFFVNEFLKTLHLDGLLRLDRASGAWQYSAAEIESRQITDNVVDLLIGRLRGLPAPTQRALELAACMGNAFDLATLAIVSETSVGDTAAALDAARASGVVIVAGKESPPAPETLYRFVHDRIQQAAYALIADEHKAQAHLTIGRLLWHRLQGAELDAKIFDVVDQLDAALPLISDAAERAQLVALNVAAGRRAKLSTAYHPAQRYFTTALKLAPADAWSARYGEMLELHIELAECEYLSGDLEASRRHFADALRRAQSDLERAKILYLQIKLLQVAGNMAAAVDIALRSFALFGLVVPATLADAGRAVQEELARAKTLIGGRAIADLLDAPLMSDANVRMIASLLEASAPPIYMVRPELFSWVTMKLVNLSLAHGNSDASSYGYGIYAILLSAVTGDVDAGYEYAWLAIRLNEKLGDVKLKGSMLHLLGDHVNFWKNHIATDLPLLRQGFNACLEGGDLIYSNYIGFQSPWHLYESGAPLSDVWQLTEKYAAFALQSKYLPVYQTIRVEQHFILALRGLTERRGALLREGFDEAAALATSEAAKFGCGIVYYHIIKLVLAYTFGDYTAALAAAERAAPELGSAFSMPIFVSYHFYYALTLAQLYAGASAADRTAYAQTIDATVAQMARWAVGCPANFAHKAALLAAESARVAGRVGEAMKHYEEALRLAHASGFAHYEALTCELAARFYDRLGGASAAGHFYRAAHGHYRRWGAAGKALQLEEAAGALMPVALPSSCSRTTSSDTVNDESFDLLPVLKASQSISGEIVLSRLLERLMGIVIEYAGAQRGSLILANPESRLVVVAEADVDWRLPISFDEATAPAPSAERLPLSIIHYVQRTGARVIIDDATVRGPYASDPYLARRRPRSILCLPIVRRNVMTGMFYLENRLVAGAFSAERLAVLELLATQAAISVDNSRLYASSQAAIKVRDDFLSMASHEMNTPLTPLTLWIQKLKKILSKGNGAIGGLDAERLPLLLDTIDRQLGRLARLVAGLLDVSRINAGKLAMQRERVDLAFLAHGVVDRHSTESQVAGCDTRVIAEGPIIGYWDPLRLEQVITNLLANAVKYAPGKPIVVSVGRQGEQAIIAVRDQGIGISSENFARIFDRFERVASSQNIGGLGLGLFISRQIVEAHGGKLRVESDVGRGATFLVELPIGDGSA
jgi:predicted ATPase/signal transduction histidine kinase